MTLSELQDLHLAMLHAVLVNAFAVGAGLGLGPLFVGAIGSLQLAIRARGRGEPPPIEILFPRGAVLNAAGATRCAALLDAMEGALRADGFGEAADFLRASAAAQLVVHDRAEALPAGDHGAERLQ